MAGLLHSLTEFQQLSPQQPSIAQRLHLGLLSHQSMIIIWGKFHFQIPTRVYIKLHTCKIDNYGELEIHMHIKTCVKTTKLIEEGKKSSQTQAS